MKSQNTMKKYIIIALSTLLLGGVFTSCREDRRISVDPQEGTHSSNSGSSLMSLAPDIEPGVLYIQVKEGISEKFKLQNSGLVLRSSMSEPLSTAMRSIGATTVEPLFPMNPRYPNRYKRAGLGQWFKVKFEEMNPLEAKSMLSKVEDVEYIEEVYKIAPDRVTLDVIPFMEGVSTDKEKKVSFNDPGLSQQWHYHNTGNASGYVKGADINLLEAWKQTTGKPNVVVAVIDGGIDYEHEDLSQSMWINQKELKGTPGVDDDHNGFIDDIYGYSFVNYLIRPLPPGAIEPDDDSHGTHVAGTIAARNNNGIGVCGVAGGDGSKDSGARLMSCAIFRLSEVVINGKKRSEQGDAPEAFQYAADNGALIAQNSWGYVYPGPSAMPRALQVAIDYFIANAGCDDDGNQSADSPMKGGIVIFAAGNDNKGYNALPGSYPKVVSVASMGPNLKKASYSNWGKWVDTTAPGGDITVFGSKGGILSTVSPKIIPGKKYAFYQGTSMATPHVSGIAALVISKMGKKGFTQQELFSRIVTSILPEDINELNPNYRDQLGMGYIDAEKTLAVNLNKAPGTPKLTLEKQDFLSLELGWKVPADEDDGTPISYRLWMSDKEFTADNYATKGTPLGDIKNGRSAVGEAKKYLVTNLKHSTTYYFALIAVDRWGIKSNVSILSANTKENHPPKIEGLPTQPILFSNLSEAKFTLTVKDEDGHKWTAELSGDSKGASLSATEDKVTVTIWPIMKEGKYKLTLTVTDELGSASSADIPYEFFIYKPPKYIGSLSEQMHGLNEGELKIPLDPLYEHDSHYKLTFKSTTSNESVLSATVDEANNLVITPKGVGEASVTIMAEDGIKSVPSVSLRVRIVKDGHSAVHMAYPIPVKRELNLLINKNIKELQLLFLSMRGEVMWSANVTPGSNNIAVVDLQKLIPGTYRMVAKASNAETEMVIVKR